MTIQTMTMPLLAQGAPDDLESMFELVVAGGPMMVPIALCSVVAVAYSVERWLRFRPGLLGSRRFGRDVVAAVREGGVEGGLTLARSKQSPLARILALALERADEPFLDREKMVGDFASNEIRRLGNNLRPLLLVWLIAPLLGLLGTVWGMIEAFGEIAGSAGIGRPELLASGIYQALTTTAAGLAVSIPAVVCYHHLRGRLDAFGRRVEDHARDLDAALRERRAELAPAPVVERSKAPSANGSAHEAQTAQTPPVPASVPIGTEA
ncbi:MotA/TolQ/ExbB proton channel family protein [Engelhardtia mirabilis]|uniref:Biopolymer transport protein ExbB n=1 Tax=Engelhardtia mirabilis TaxID=2528011 RepID=A0A518BG75_9BACT|nr:Biopolymer transport protein ExbB [Planctomycetes bacterium Pla133]QDV00313.1 Biopolymer transport protein ExbB [Planctomycetes bacterium Pla86]